jgi:hypothetical protein
MGHPLAPAHLQHHLKENLTAGDDNIYTAYHTKIKQSVHKASIIIILQLMIEIPLPVI